MTVKVIKKAKRPPKEVVCPNCGSTCAYEDGDVQKYSGTDYGGGPDGRWWITCAGCKKEITLKSW